MTDSKRISKQTISKWFYVKGVIKLLRVFIQTKLRKINFVKNKLRKNEIIFFIILKLSEHL